LTTHSPFVVQSISGGMIIDLDSKSKENNNNIKPWKSSVEEISKDIMHVDTNRSKRFQEMMDLATKYYSMLNAENNYEDNELNKIQDELDNLQIEFSDDPAYVALLMAEGRKKGVVK